MAIDAKELETIKLLTPEERHVFFMENILENDQVWGLCGEGWASFLDDNQGIQAFPVWSEKEFAELNAIGEWQGFNPMPFTVQQLTEELVPELAQANLQISIFKFPEDSGHLVKAEFIALEIQKRKDA